MTEQEDQPKSAGERINAVARIVWRIIKWPILVAIPIGVLAFTAWWSLISALTSEVLSVPELRGRTLEEARFALSSRSLKAVITDERKYSQEVDEGLVLESDPPAGAQIKRGRSVRLVFSAGFERTLAPDLQSKSLREAELLGAQRGFRIGSIVQVYSDTSPVGRIIAQNPLPYTALVAESLDVLVSRGPSPRLALIPDFANKPVLPVREQLRASGFACVIRRRGENTDISNSDPFELRNLYIYRQWPAAGSFIDTSSPETILLRVDWRR